MATDQITAEGLYDDVPEANFYMKGNIDSVTATDENK